MDLKQLIEQIARDGDSVLVVGLGISGVAAAEFLSQLGIFAVCVEKSSKEDYRRRSRYVERTDALEARGVRLIFGIDGEQISPHISNVKLAVLSPGVSLESAVVGTIQRHKIPWVSELELGVQLHGGPSVVVTGSNGKSTTASLIHHFMHIGGLKSFLCGNVGIPVIESKEIVEAGNLATEPSNTILVVEASSYQLEACSVLKPKVSVMLNISENHLERHGTIQRYAQSKARIFRLQGKEDLAIVNADDRMVCEMASGCQASKAFVGFEGGKALEKLSSNWATVHFVDNWTGIIELSLDGICETYSTDRCKLLGRHNRFNMAVAALAARFMGASQKAVEEGIRSFIPLEHRVEFLDFIRQPLVINDSKSTTVAATQVAFTAIREAFPERTVTLMIGGLSKAGSWEPLLKDLRREQGALLPIICFGRDGGLLASHCKAHSIPCVIAESLQEGVDLAFSQTAREGVILLSPGCASFDEFTDFEHRGTEFKKMAALKVVLNAETI